MRTSLTTLKLRVVGRAHRRPVAVQRQQLVPLALAALQHMFPLERLRHGFLDEVDLVPLLDLPRAPRLLAPVLLLDEQPE